MTTAKRCVSFKGSDNDDNGDNKDNGETSRFV